MKRDQVEDIYELSPLQQGMLFHTLLTPGSGTYFEQVVFTLEGAFDVSAFERAWQTVVDRHPILRTSFHWTRLAKPLQVVYRKVKLPVQYLDWSFLPDPAFGRRLEVLLKEEQTTGFKLSEPPLLRLTVIAKALNSHVIVFSLHHVLLDGWSSNLVYNEAASLYAAYSSGRELTLPKSRPYGDYIAWLQHQDSAAAEHYWRDRLRGYAGPAPLEIGLPTSSLHEDATYEVCEGIVARPIAEALRYVARTHQVTLNTIVQATWALLLSRYGGQQDVVLGATVAGRPAELDGIESMVGLFINTLPVRVQVRQEMSLLECLHELQRNQAEAGRFEHVALNQIHAWSEVPRDMPLFETLIGFENFPAAGGEIPANGSQSKVRLFSQTNYPLTLAVIPGASEWSLKLIYARPRFEAVAMERLLGHFQQLLASIGNNPNRQLVDLDLLTEAERGWLTKLNDTARDYPRNATIVQLFEAQVLRAPDAVAVSVEGAELTYDELNRRANRLAGRLRSMGVGLEVIAGICVESQIDVVTAMLAVLKAGGAYLPLDQSYPDERLQYMLRDSGAAVLVTNRHFSGDSWAQGVTCVDVEDAENSGSDANLAACAGADNLAYVMYTSGSTGGPKGVEITHRAVIRTVVSTDYVSPGPSDVTAQLANVCFDAATFEIWGPLLNGGCIAGISRSVALSPDDFANALSNQKVSTIFVTTDLFNQLVRTRPDTFSSVENLLVGGSAINVQWIDACLRGGPPRRLLHVYGPTESTTFATWHLIEAVPEGAASIPIGRPLANTQIYVLDQNLSQVPAGVIGEIYIGGDGLARCYRDRPELTAEKFIPDPFTRQPGSRLYRTGDRARRNTDGAVEFLGRFDDQVKIRGFRVEPGEVETVIKGHSGVSEAVVLARHDVPGTTNLVAYVVPKNGNLLTSDLRGYLGERLPEYMRPSAYVFCDAMPLTPNGKADRSALAARTERYSPTQPQTEPRTPAEKILVEIWRDVLAVASVGIHDNFFELGGDSIISIQIISRAREAGLNLTLRQLFDNRTIAELAAVAGSEVASQAETGVLEGELPLMPVQQWFLEQEPASLHHFNQSSLIEVPAGLSPVWLTQATEHLLLHHDSLRLRFRKDGDRWLQWYAAPSSAPFEVIKADDVSPVYRTSWLEREIARIQESLDLEHGPVARLVWFDFGPEPGRLLFLVHHLAVDTVSWRILMEDFWRAYSALARGEAVSLPRKTSSLRQWANRLVLHAQSTQVRDELPYWSDAVNSQFQVPRDFPGNDNLAATAVSVTKELTEQETREMLQETPKAYQTQINDVLLTALARVLSAWTGQRAVTFDLEGHGREPIFDDLDVTRTAGWFTTIFPVRLEITTADSGEMLRSVKEQLRRVPHHGLSFGLLRYLTPPGTLDVRSLRGPSPDVAFNYLGQFDQVQELESTGPERSPLANRFHLIEINAAVYGRRLRVSWEFSEVNHHRNTIEHLATEFMDQLTDLVAHCRASEQIQFTPSDFAQAGISQSELDKLVAIVDGTERPAR